MTYPVNTEIQLHWGEMDAMGHINNAVYFKYFETARIEYFILLGQDNIHADMGEGPILANISCQYIRPITYPDKLMVSCWIERIGNTSLQMKYEIFSQTQQQKVSTGDSIVVMIDYRTGNKILVSDELKEKIYELQPKLKPE